MTDTTRRVLGHITVPFLKAPGVPTAAAVPEQVVAVTLHIRNLTEPIEEYLPTGLTADASDRDVIEYAWSRATIDTSTLRRGDAAAITSRAMTRIGLDLALIDGQLRTREHLGRRYP